MNDTKPDSNYGTAVINVNPKYKWEKYIRQYH
jgi:hypothetical protein